MILLIANKAIKYISIQENRTQLRDFPLQRSWQHAIMTATLCMKKRYVVYLNIPAKNWSRIADLTDEIDKKHAILSVKASFL